MEGGKTVRHGVPKFTSERDESVKILVKSCISKVDSIWKGVSRQFCAVRPWEEEACSYQFHKSSNH